MLKKTIRDHIHFDGIALLLALIACICFARITYPLRDTWPGLPPAAKYHESLVYGYGDVELSYRNIGMMLQNAGDTGGRVTNLRNYDYQMIEDWLWVTYDLDKRANYVPSLAAFYFGANPEKEQLRHLIDYLAKVGQDEEDISGERWRWLAHAVYLARFKIDDQQKALELANILANLKNPDMPIWTKQMPAFVMTKVGQKKAARDLMMTIMATDKTIDPAEVNQTCWYINEHLRESDDGLEKNEIYQLFCSKIMDTSGKNK